MSDKKLSTKLIHTGDGQDYKKIAQSTSVPEVLPVYLTSVFEFDDVPSVDDIYDHKADGYIYSRIKHPNTDAVADILAAGILWCSGVEHKCICTVRDGFFCGTEQHFFSAHSNVRSQ